MKRLWNGLWIAFSMYSRIPVPQAAWTPEGMREVFCFFPLVGLVTGGVLWSWLWLAQRLGLTAALTAAAATALPLLCTGGIHLDGFCDTVDALSSHGDREKKLAILKDSHVGAFAVMGCGLYLLLTFGLWSEYRFSPRGTAALALGWALSRSLSGLSVVTFPKARREGTAATFAQASPRHVAAVLAVWAAACAGGMLWLAPAVGGACLGAAVLVFCYYRHVALGQFGGVTGDLAGWFLQLCEGGMLLAAVCVEVFG